MKNYYTIPAKLFCRIKHNIKQSPSFRKELKYGLVQKEGKILLTDTGMQVLEYYNLPHTELAEIVSV